MRETKRRACNPACPGKKDLEMVMIDTPNIEVGDLEAKKPSDPFVRKYETYWVDCLYSVTIKVERTIECEGGFTEETFVTLSLGENLLHGENEIEVRMPFKIWRQVIDQGLGPLPREKDEGETYPVWGSD